MIKYNVITLFPDLISKHLEYLPFKKALEKGLLEVNLVNLRGYALDDYGSVDDKPYGGGVGMLLRVEPIYNALHDLKLVEGGKLSPEKDSKSKVVLLSPQGRKFIQKKAQRYCELEEITLICGRYEGVDARVESFVDEVVSMGDYILSGGELGALAIMESTTRLLPGIMEKEEATKIESFSQGKENQLEFPQYTRPEDFKGLKVPEVLLSGDHGKIAKWRENNLRTTEEK